MYGYIAAIAVLHQPMPNEVVIQRSTSLSHDGALVTQEKEQRNKDTYPNLIFGLGIVAQHCVKSQE
jgi:hypothetical protein